MVFEILWIPVSLSDSLVKRGEMMFKIAKIQIIFLLVWMQTIVLIGFAQPQEKEDFFNTKEKIELSEKDIAEIIKCFETNNLPKLVETFKSKMPPVTEKKVREEILQNLPAIVKKLKINNSEIIESFRRIVAPVLDFYKRKDVYEIIVIRHQTPVMFSDSGVVLVVSSGMIERMQNDDVLLGFVAHELAHEYFAKASIHTKYVIGLTESENEYKALTRKYQESLSLIELQCDSFSALTLADFGYNPLAFIEEIENIEKEYPNFVGTFHPDPTIRRKVVESILTGTKISNENKISTELQKLKKMLK